LPDTGVQDYLAQGDSLTDPILGNLGEQQAKLTGQWLHDFLVKKIAIGRPGVKAIPFFTSSLDRCIATAMIVAACICKDELEYQPTLHVLDWLREWVGWGHNSNTDKRSTKTEILEKHQANTKLEFQPNFTQNDEMFSQSPLEETWTAVGQRWVKAIDLAFKHKFGNNPRIGLIVGNNRSIQCGLRALELDVDEVMMAVTKPPGKLVVEDMNNAAVMALLVKRFNPDKDQIAARTEKWKAIERDEVENIKELRRKERLESEAQLKKLLEQEGKLRDEFLEMVPEQTIEKIKRVTGLDIPPRR